MSILLVVLIGVFTGVTTASAQTAGGTASQAGTPAVPLGNPENRVYRAKNIEVNDPLRDFIRKRRREAPTDSFFVPDQKKLALDLPNMVRDPYADEDDFDTDADDGPGDLMEAAAEFKDQNNLRKEQLGDLGGDFYTRDVVDDLPFKSKDDELTKNKGNADSEWLEGRDDPNSQIDEINESLRRNKERHDEIDEESVLGRNEREGRDNRVAPADNVIRPDGTPPRPDKDERETKSFNAADMNQGYGRFLGPKRSGKAVANTSAGISAARNADVFASGGLRGNAIADLVAKHTGGGAKPSFKPEVRPENDQKKFTLEFNKDKGEDKRTFANLSDVGQKFTLPRRDSALNRPGPSFDERLDDLKPKRSALSIGAAPLASARKPPPSPSRRPAIQRTKPTPEFKKRGFMNKPLESGFGSGFKRPRFGR